MDGNESRFLSCNRIEFKRKLNLSIIGIEKDAIDYLQERSLSAVMFTISRLCPGIKSVPSDVDYSPEYFKGHDLTADCTAVIHVVSSSTPNLLSIFRRVRFNDSLPNTDRLPCQL